ncbi:acyltransferase family protein [Hymenobacter busanensis]|nr:acyltransferase family protein [Hymenobacter busanensis]
MKSASTWMPGLKHNDDMTTSKKIYFPGLNFFRFVAASLVVLVHTEEIKGLHAFHNVYKNYPTELIGRLAVIFFFVLSGFLISYLLFAEKTQNKSISI